jgi:hypothetical protein
MNVVWGIAVNLAKTAANPNGISGHQDDSKY